MTIRTPVGRVAPPVILRPDTPTPGRATPRGPLRREGPAKLTGTALYTDDLVFPGRLVRRDDPLDRGRARGSSAIDLDPAFDWSRVVVVTAADIPGAEHRQPRSRTTSRSWSADEIRHHAEPVALVAAPDRRAPARGGRPTSACAPSRCRPSSTRSPAEQVFAHYEIETGDLAAGFAQADLVVEGEYRVGHQEQLYIENNAMIAVPRDDGGVAVHGSLQCPYYVHKALKPGARS